MNRLRTVVSSSVQIVGNVLRRIALRVAALSPVASRAYYGIFSGRFSRETQAVASGISSYHEDLQSESSSSALLRRNIHRLEKGLLMRPRKSVFATDYIEETVASFERLKRFHSTSSSEDGELNWAADVLAEYFANVEDHPQIASARKLVPHFSRFPQNSGEDPSPSGDQHKGAAEL